MAKTTRTHLMDGGGTAAERNPMVRRHLSKKEFADNLHKLLLRRGWKQADLARATGIPRDAVSRYIREMSLPEPSNLVKMADAFGMKPEDLLPNYAEVEIELATDSPLEIKTSSADPTMAWIRINRMIKVSALPGILAALEAAENA